MISLLLWLKINFGIIKRGNLGKPIPEVRHFTELGIGRGCLEQDFRVLVKN